MALRLSRRALLRAAATSLPFTLAGCAFGASSGGEPTATPAPVPSVTVASAANAQTADGPAGTPDCAGNERPQVRMDGSLGTLHPATERYIIDGLQPGGDDRVFATATADASPELVGPDAEGTLANTLRSPHVEERFHVVVQIRSTPDAPMRLRLTRVHPFDWLDCETLRATVEVEPWGPFDRIDDDARREQLRSADELVYTAVWSLTPALFELPREVVLTLASRG